MNEVIVRHGGQINNYIGDGFLALFDVKGKGTGYAQRR